MMAKSIRIKTKSTFIILIALAIILLNLHVWNIVNFGDFIGYDSRSKAQQKLLDELNEYDADDGNNSADALYQDEEVTEEEIKLFGPLAEKEVHVA